MPCTPCGMVCLELATQICARAIQELLSSACTNSGSLQSFHHSLPAPHEPTEGFIESAEPVKPEAARKLTHMPLPPDPLPPSPRAPRPAAAAAARPAAAGMPAARPAAAAAPSSKKAAPPLQHGRGAGNGGSGHAGNGASGGMGRSRSGVGDGGAKSSSSGWGGTKQYILHPAPPSATNAWAPSSASMAATAASLAETERQEADRAARLQADAQAREEAVLALSCDALDAMRA